MYSCWHPDNGSPCGRAHDGRPAATDLVEVPVSSGHFDIDIGHPSATCQSEVTNISSQVDSSNNHHGATGVAEVIAEVLYNSGQFDVVDCRRVATNLAEILAEVPVNTSQFNVSHGHSVATDQSDVPDNSVQFDIGCGPPVATGHSQVPFISGQFDVSDGVAAATNVVEIPAEVLHNIGQFDIDDVHFLSTNAAEIPENTGQFDISDGYPMASDPAEVPVNSGQFDIGSGHPTVIGLADGSKRLSNALRNALEVLNFDGVNTHNVLNQNELCEDSAVDDTANLRSRARCKKSPALWKCNVRKRLRNSGQSYTDRFGAQKSRKVMKPGCGLKCHKHCHQLISLDDRERLFHDFWRLGKISDQREYLVRHVIRKPVKSKSKNSPNHNHVKKLSFHYSFVVKNTTISVCKIFFLHSCN